MDKEKCEDVNAYKYILQVNSVIEEKRFYKPIVREISYGKKQSNNFEDRNSFSDCCFSMKKGDEHNAVTEIQEKVEEGNLTGFYVQKETKELHISQVNVDAGIE